MQAQWFETTDIIKSAVFLCSDSRRAGVRFKERKSVIIRILKCGHEIMRFSGDLKSATYILCHAEPAEMLPIAYTIWAIGIPGTPGIPETPYLSYFL